MGDMLIVNVGKSVNATIVFEFLALPGFDPHTIVLRNLSTTVGQNDLVGQVMLDALKHREFNSTSGSNYIVMWRNSRSVIAAPNLIQSSSVYNNIAMSTFEWMILQARLKLA